MKFRVIDNKTGKEADVDEIVNDEEWADSLIYCDIEGFAIMQDGNLILLDECGNYEYCPSERFKVVFYEERKQNEGEFTLFKPRRENRNATYKCSVCGKACNSYYNDVGEWNFCPHCGAKMKGE